jgi:predicted short-subunit dehydrogenase-like oxidoreductase (DUF2520 family)
MGSKLTVGLIGSDVVGRTFAEALESSGHVVIEDWQAADLLLLAVPSGELEQQVQKLTAEQQWQPGQLVAHLAGEFGYSVLTPALEAGVIPLAIHPAMQFTDTATDLLRMRESYFAVSAPEPALPIAQALVIDIGSEPIAISEENRAKYFEAWSVASNFSAMVVSQAIGLLEEIGIEHARAVIAPAVRSSVDQALAMGHKPIDPDELLG